ncbi:peptidoglycan bridge formation glycyltransferase FemA/FemB family protein [Candidatus Wolfebacteria bacterium]|nr:peptidoglycan bridge formation glycyltransferase FemA/FemB family protein [Candidatus Wolfebacteria bacterium]
MIKIQEITDKKIWEDFVVGQKPHSDLQSWGWGEFNQMTGEKIWRLGIYDNGRQPTANSLQLIGVCLIIKFCAKRGTFFFIPHGPIFSEITNYKLQIANLMDYLKNLAKKENCWFLRISSDLPNTKENEKIFRNLGFVRAPMHMHAELMWVLDITPPEDELLKNMRKTTRYLINKAQKDGVQIIKSKNPEDVDIFNKLYKETATRQNFFAYKLEYLKESFKSLVSDDQTMLFFAKYNGEFVASAMIDFYAESAFYKHGASSHKYPKISAPYLLQWEAIKEAKKRGLKFYNFWGVSPDNKPKHPWAGLSLFKKGFGGFAEEYLPAQDLPVKKSYWLTYAFEKIRKIKRRL